MGAPHSEEQTQNCDTAQRTVKLGAPIPGRKQGPWRQRKNWYEVGLLSWLSGASPHVGKGACLGIILTFQKGRGGKQCPFYILFGISWVSCQLVTVLASFHDSKHCLFCQQFLFPSSTVPDQFCLPESYIITRLFASISLPLIYQIPAVHLRFQKGL